MAQPGRVERRSGPEPGPERVVASNQEAWNIHCWLFAPEYDHRRTLAPSAVEAPVTSTASPPA